MKKVSFRFVKGTEKSHRAPSEASNRNGVMGRWAALRGGRRILDPEIQSKKQEIQANNEAEFLNQNFTGGYPTQGLPPSPSSRV